MSKRAKNQKHMRFILKIPTQQAVSFIFTSWTFVLYVQYLWMLLREKLEVKRGYVRFLHQLVRHSPVWAPEPHNRDGKIGIHVSVTLTRPPELFVRF
jgi:hypothetical protein